MTDTNNRIQIKSAMLTLWAKVASDALLYAEVAKILELVDGEKPEVEEMAWQEREIHVTGKRFMISIHPEMTNERDGTMISIHAVGHSYTLSEWASLLTSIDAVLRPVPMNSYM